MSRPRIIGLLLALLTFVVFLPAIHHDFINYDDNVYVTQNPEVRAGFTGHGLRQAFTSWHASNWHPLTWLSHMLDCELFRLNPAGHHLVNVVFHAANAALLFALLWRLTAAVWPAALTAALFAWHPLHVESVAWVSERKDVLSTFFGLLSLLAYVRSVRDHDRRHRWLAFAFLLLGLMAKPMLVSLPCVMLLLDYWPLARSPRFDARSWGRLVLEKLPFFALAAASCVVTFFAQRESAVASLEKVPLLLRGENAVTAYVAYLAKAIWPDHLSIFYPLPPSIPAWQVAFSAALLAALSIAVFRLRHRSPCLLTGWLWYLGTLVPVIGLVQVGDQAMADRYSYFPLIGIFFAVVFFAADRLREHAAWRRPLTTAAVLGLVGCIVLTERQLSCWRDSETLFRHALAVADDNALARLNLGAALEQKGRPAEARTEYERALQLDPRRYEACDDLARLLTSQGKPAEALPYSREAVRLNPRSPVAHFGLGIILSDTGDLDAAAGEFAEAARLDADYAAPRFRLGRIAARQGRPEEATAQFHEALRLDPDNFQMLVWVARWRSSDPDPRMRDGAEALALAQRAVKLDPNAVALDTLAMAFAENGRYDDAVTAAGQALAAAGSKEDAASIRERLERYRRHQPWREPSGKN